MGWMSLVSVVFLGVTVWGVWRLPHWVSMNTNTPPDSWRNHAEYDGFWSTWQSDNIQQDDITQVIPVVGDVVDDEVGWSREDGWCPLAELMRIKREAAQMTDEETRVWLDAHWTRSMVTDMVATPIFAELVREIPMITTHRPLELLAAA